MKNIMKMSRHFNWFTLYLLSEFVNANSIQSQKTRDPSEYKTEENK